MRLLPQSLHPVSVVHDRRGLTGLNLKKRYYIMLVSRENDGTLTKTAVPLGYAYGLAAAAVVGLFTVTGLAGSYSRMLIKTAHFNQLRQDHSSLQRDYAHLEDSAKERDVQVASLGGLATEVSALYGMTASKLAVPIGQVTSIAHRGKGNAGGMDAVAHAPLATEADSDTAYYKSLETFYALRMNAFNGSMARAMGAPVSPMMSLGTSLNRLPGVDSALDASVMPTLWPVMGPVTSGFGQREDPVLGTGEGEFHKGIDIAAPEGTPIRATGSGLVLSAALGNGYGREVVIDHGRGLKTIYGHMSGFNVIAGQTVVTGQVIGYVGHSGRATGNHVHYEVRIHDIAVNPHKYLRTTIADLGGTAASGL